MHVQTFVAKPRLYRIALKNRSVHNGAGQGDNDKRSWNSKSFQARQGHLLHGHRLFDDIAGVLLAYEVEGHDRVITRNV